jgi:hypothetical protein
MPQCQNGSGAILRGRAALEIGPQPPEWQHIGNQIEAAFILARADFVNVD